jgi:Domain of unknown function (DUF4232)
VITSVARWVLLASVTALLTACTGSSGSPAASGSPATSASSASPTPAGSAPASSAASGSAPSTPAPPSTPPVTSPAAAVAGAWSGTGALCPDLQVKLGLAQGTSNTTYQVIDFVNHGSVACIMSGYPGVNLAGGTPAAPIGLPAAHTEFPAARLVTLQPGEVGNALLQITDAHTYAAAKCGPVQAQYLIVYRPNKAAPVKLAYGTTACSQPVRMLQISAISLGAGG